MNEAQVERLAKLAEECGEVIQIIGKILCHGIETSCPVPHPLGQDTNSVTLEHELIDVIMIMALLAQEGDIRNLTDPTIEAKDLEDYSVAKLERLNKYLHHNHLRI